MKETWLTGVTDPRGRSLYRYRWSADHRNGFEETVLTFDEHGKLLSIDSRPLPRDAGERSFAGEEAADRDIPLPLRPEPE